MNRTIKSRCPVKWTAAFLIKMRRTSRKLAYKLAYMNGQGVKKLVFIEVFPLCLSLLLYVPGKIFSTSPFSGGEEKSSKKSPFAEALLFFTGPSRRARGSRSARRGSSRPHRQKWRATYWPGPPRRGGDREASRRWRRRYSDTRCPGISEKF